LSVISRIIKSFQKTRFRWPCVPPMAAERTGSRDPSDQSEFKDTQSLASRPPGSLQSGTWLLPPSTRGPCLKRSEQLSVAKFSISRVSQQITTQAEQHSENILTTRTNGMVQLFKKLSSIV